MKTLFASILTLALLSFAVPSFAVDNTNQVTVANAVSPTATQVIDKFGDRIDQLITTLASKAGVATEHFYPIFVRQQVVTGIFELSLMFIGLVLGIVFLRIGYVNMEKMGDDDYKKRNAAEAKTGAGYVIGAIVTIITVLFILIQGSDSLSKVCNPEYNAVQSLVHMVR